MNSRQNKNTNGICHRHSLLKSINSHGKKKYNSNNFDFSKHRKPESLQHLIAKYPTAIVIKVYYAHTKIDF